MDFSKNEASPLRKYGGISVVILVHVLVAYAFMTGLARKMVDVIKQPVETKIIEEVKPPPPPDQPPPPPPPKVAAPPPPFIPPPEVMVQTPPQQNVIRDTTAVQPPAQPFKPSAPVEAPVAAKPSAPPVAAILNLNDCKPEYPRSSLAAEEQGVSRVQFKVGPDGQLVSAGIVKSSGSKALDKAAVNGLSRCKFRPAYQDGKPVESSFTVDYVWNMEQ
jgi:protein TonB